MQQKWVQYTQYADLFARLNASKHFFEIFVLNLQILKFS